MNVVIRRARGEADCESVRGLMREYAAHLGAHPAGAANICLGGFDLELAGLPGPYAEPEGVLLMAEVDGRAAGCCAFRPLRPMVAGWVGERACEMKRMWVDREFRGLGLGLGLVKAGVVWARAQGYDAVYLDTVPTAMPEANALYERQGFRRVNRYNDNPVVDVVFFRLGLEEASR